MPDDQFDRDLVQRLRAYESRIPDVDAPRLEDSAGRRRGWAKMVAVGAIAAVAGGTLAFVVMNSAREELGDASPTLEMTEAASPPRSPSPTVSASASPTAAPVPPLTASNGANGTPVSWCWDDECVEGTLDFDDLERYPEIGTFFSVASDRAITRLEATAYASAGDVQPLEMASANEIHVWPPESRLVLVRAEFEGGGDASYAWRLVRQIIVGVGEDRVVILEPLVEVTPPRGPGDATVDIAYTDQEMLGIEGAALFLKATTHAGTVVLDRITSQNGGAERLPPASYVLSAYYRTCSGSCEVLDTAESFCSVDTVLAPDERTELIVSMSERSCEVRQRD